MTQERWTDHLLFGAMSFMLLCVLVPVGIALAVWRAVTEGEGK